MNKLQSIISANAVDVINNHHLSFQQVKAVNSIASCHTPNMGSHKLSCKCGHEKIVSNSCDNRHCPSCGSFKKELWVQKQQEALLPSHYFHLVFTLPDSLRELIYFNQKILYNLMYEATSKTITQLSKDKLGITSGALKLTDGLKYLGRYTHKIAISDYRIVSFSDTCVSFSYLDNKDNGKKKVMTLSKDEFIRRFLLHVLPHKFTKIRHYGFLSNRMRRSNVALCRKFIAKQRGLILPVIKSLDKLDLLVKLIGKEKICCPKCGNYYTYTHDVQIH